jgi:hypothetical protein
MTRSAGACEFNICTVADTSGDFADFAPFVPAMSGAGEVAFQATLRDGTTGLESRIEPEVAVVSHPALSSDGLRLLGIGDTLFNQDIIEFAANPVSISGGPFALRVRFVDGGQQIVRLDPIP